MSYERMGDAVVGLIRLMAILLCIFMPLGLWKFGELVWWLIQHIHIGWN